MNRIKQTFLALGCMVALTTSVAAADTQLVYEGNLQFDAATTGNTRVVLTQDGKMGLKTTSPFTNLDVMSGAGPYLGMRVGYPGTNKGLYMGQVATSLYPYIGGSTYYYNSYQWLAKEPNVSSIRFDNGSIGFFSNSGLTDGSLYYPSERMKITSSGQIGIGTSFPFDKAFLDIGYSSSNAYLPQIVLAGSQFNSFLHGIGDGAGPAFNVGIRSYQSANPAGPNWATSKGTTGAFFKHDTQGLSIFYDTGLQINQVYTPTIKIKLNPNGNSYFKSGNVGIGTNSPIVRLQVQDSAHGPYTLSSHPYYLYYVSGTVQNISGMGSGNGTALTTYEVQATNGQNQQAFIGAVSENTASNAPAALVFGQRTGAINWTERMRIKSNGNVGIGTNSPYSKLDVNGTLGVFGSGLNGSTLQRFVLYADTTYGLLFEAPIRPDNTKLPIKFTWRGDSNPALLIDGDKKVGVGTINPYSKLDVNGTFGLYGSGLNGSTLQRFVLYADATYGLLFEAPLKADNTKLPIKFAWRGDSNPALVISGDKKIGIGTTSPTTKLHVAGTITADEINVPLSNWADYVFEDAYKLRSLKEVESFIRKNKHLPDIPSEAELKKSNLSMGKMQSLQMQKIEELTLYAIEQEKQIDTQEKINQAQADEIDLLKQRLNQVENLLERVTGQKLPEASRSRWYQFWK